MDILELYSLTEEQGKDLLGLMEELDPEVTVTVEEMRAAVEMSGTHFFAAVDDDGHIAGCATLCVFGSPTGLKASVEDVVVSQACRGQHIGKRLMEHIITYARTNLADVDLCLTSRPHRVAANNLYKSLGFQPKETNVYKMPIKR